MRYKDKMFPQGWLAEGLNYWAEEFAFEAIDDGERAVKNAKQAHNNMFKSGYEGRLIGQLAISIC